MKNCNFDERQLQKRGDAFKIGFFTLLIENAVVLFLFAFLYDDPAQIRKLPITPSTLLALQIMIAVAVFAGSCIRNDCYFSLEDNRKRLMILFSATIILNLICAAGHIIHGDFLEDGVLGTAFLNLSCSLMLLFILVMILLQRRRNKEEEEA